MDLDEGVVRSMSITQLNQLASDAGVDLADAETKTEMVDILLSALS